MKHNETVESEFTRQAETFRSSATLSADAITARVGEALAPDTRRVLDIACGPGLLLPTLAEHAETVVGIDLTRKSLRLARQDDTTKRVHLARSLAESIPFADASFDAVVLRLALHHFVDPEAVLSAAHRVLGGGGRLVVLDVLGPSDGRMAELRDALERLRDPSHTALLSRERMEEALDRRGFSVREASLWSQTRAFPEWARIINEPRRMADLEIVLRALLQSGDPTGLALREEAGELTFTYDWGLFVAETPPTG